MTKNKKTKNLVKSLENSLVEKDVENAYRAAFEKEFPGYISSPNQSDGVLRNHVITSLLEFKYDLDLRNSLEQAGVIVQSIYYLKKMMDRGDTLTKAVFIGDINECFCVPVSSLVKYLSYGIDWSIPPSSAAKKNPALVAEIAQNEEIEPFIYDIDKNFDFLAVLEKMKNISLDKPFAIPITKKNIVEIFKRFEKDVVRDKYFTAEQVFKKDENKRMSELADLFFTCLTAPSEAYLHPKKKNTVVARGKEIKVNSKNYRIFFSQFKQEYRPSELEAITANKDRILEDTYRRHTGAFFTPDIWVDEAHKMIADEFGENWKEEYVVWDCAAGTANLTRGKKFKELYVSTLDVSDINTIKDCGYNPEATIFQYDFLNEVGIDSCPDNLKKAFEEGKKVLFLINPPYATDGKFGKKNGDSKAGVAQSVVNIEMKKEKMGKSASQLYSQFLYKIAKIEENYKNDINIGAFTKPTFLSSNTFNYFRKLFFNNFKYLSGMLLQASNFADVKGFWGISFSIFKSGNDNSCKFNFILKCINTEQYKIEDMGIKTVYAIDKNSRAADWIREEIKNKKRVEAPQLSTYVSVKDKGYGFSIINSMGNACFHGNNVYKNQTDIFMVSSCASVGPNGGAINIIPENFNKVVALFTARKSIKGNWINDKDEYLVPNIEHSDYEQWNNDAIVYSLFNNSSQQSSLRNITYKDKKWDIVNNFFFMSNEEMLELADSNNFNLMYQDAKVNGEDRYVYNALQETTLSEDAKEILTMAKELMRKSMSMRELYNESNPKYHLSSWDAGWAQLKPMFKEYFKDDYTLFVEKYKKFENRMRKGVYKFGFLKE
jgi:hypothetical protein